jgi:hypothetical protein
MNRVIDMKKLLYLVLFIVLSTGAAHATHFEELDKPPEGAHKGQILLGAFASVGVPFGRIIDAENDFIRDSTYTFFSSLTTKKIMVRQLSFSYGVLFEYMMIDFLGIKIKMKRSNIVQQTIFGPQYQNWNKMMYNDYSFLLGPAIHFTSRKQWDISLTPVAGYAIGEYNAAPIEDELVYSFTKPSLNQLIWGYGAKRKKKADNVVVGAELNVSVYFTGGFFMSFGCDWTMNMLEFRHSYYLMNPQNFQWFFPMNTSSFLHSICFILSAGYAFSN